MVLALFAFPNFGFYSSQNYNCEHPVAAPNASIVSVKSTAIGGTAVCQCDEGFEPRHQAVIVCSSTRVWLPNPANIQCSKAGVLHCYMQF